ncbi:MAG: hypothetical protein K6E88_05540 [Lachnospiraceae bacterium]|nr:hypothetical protein [Lachnospiraceae bacterium]
MDEMRKKERKVSIIMAVILSSMMGILFSILVRRGADAKALESMPPMPVMLITSLLESVTVGVILVLILPLGKLGRSLAGKAGAQPPSMKFTLLNSLPFAVISAVFVSAIVCFISVAIAHGKMTGDVQPLMEMWAKNWLKSLPLSVIVSYVLSILISPVVVKKVGLGGPPARPGQAGQ